MYNVMLDALPYDWKGYPIDADFRIGIMISQCMADESLSDMERFSTVAELLFPEVLPSVEEISEAVHWFLTEYNHDNDSKKKENGTIIFDFDVDQWRIYAAFRAQYGIDLNTAQMHWFIFMGLLANIGECSLTRVMNIRGKKITSRMGREEKQAIKDAKRVFAIKSTQDDYRELSREEQEAIAEFLQYARPTEKGGGREG